MTSADGDPSPGLAPPVPGAPRVHRVPSPVPEPIALAVERLAERATTTDGVAPLDDDARLGLRHDGSDRLHLLALIMDSRGGSSPDVTHSSMVGAGVCGYAQLDPVTGGIALVVDPSERRRGIGTLLLDAAVAALEEAASHQSAGERPAPSGWAHGDLPAAAAFAARHGFSPSRTLLQLRRGLDDALPAVRLAEGYRLRAFVPGEDDAAWLALNAAAFAEYPDQGRLTQADLDARMREPWFDPAGLLLAETDDGDLAAFHWTKVHDRTEDDASPAGEVYVLAVHPAHQGHGLGAALLTAGLAHLREQRVRGEHLHRVLLYVDAANAPANAVYERLGFTAWRVDVHYTLGV